MYIGFLVFSLLASTLYAYSDCPATRVLDCTTKAESSGCGNFYQFAYNSATAIITTNPVYCINGPGTNCVAATGLTAPCNPACNAGKSPGPNGQICSDFSNSQTNCRNFYADESGDRWCYFDAGVCKKGIICHD